MATEFEVRRSKWAWVKVLIGSSAASAICILLALVDFPFIVRATICFVGILFALGACGMAVGMSRDLPVCIVRDDGILLPRSAFSRGLSLLPWATVHDATLVDLAPASAPIGRKGAFGEPAIRLTLTERFMFSHGVLIMVGESDHTPGEIYSSIRAHITSS